MIKTVYFSSEDTGEKVLSNLELFSLAQDLRIAKLPIRQKLRAIIREYSKYIKMKKSTLDQDTINEIDKLLVQKFNTLINDCEDKIRENVDLNNLLGITEKSLKLAVTKFSRTYKKLLIARDSFGYIPKLNQVNSDDAYKAMIGELRKIVFEPVLTLFSLDPNALPPEAKEDGMMTHVLEQGKPTLAQLYDNVVGIMRKENIEVDITLEDDKIILTPKADFFPKDIQLMS